MEEISLTGVGDIVDYLSNIKDSYYYRGVSDYDKYMSPRLRTENYSNNEVAIIKDFYNQYYQLEKKEQNFIEILSLGQHYGLVTRLLDLTINPFIALFFAIGKEEDIDDSKIYICMVNKDLIKNMPTVEMPLNVYKNNKLNQLPTMLKDVCYFDIHSNILITDLNKVSFNDRYQYFINGISDYFVLKYEYPEKNLTNRRLIKQGGTFVYFSNINNGFQRDKIDRILSLEITKKQKEELLTIMSKFKEPITKESLLGDEKYCCICEEINCKYKD